MKIFILEDDLSFINLYKILLKENTLFLFSTYEDALLALKDNEYDLYILDVRLKNTCKKTGLDILDAIPYKDKVILVSGIDITQFLKDRLLNVDFLLKPFLNNQLKKIIDEKKLHMV